MEYHPMIIWIDNLPTWAGGLILWGSAILVVAIPLLLYNHISPKGRRYSSK